MQALTTQAPADVPDRSTPGPARRAPRLLAAGAAVVAALTVVPLVYLVERALDRGWSFVADEILTGRTARLVLRSLGLVGTVTVGCVLLGVALAVLVTRTDLPWRRGWAVVLSLPLALPSYLVASLWDSAWPAVDGFWGATLVLILVSYPYVMLPTVAAVTRVDPAHEEVARSLGLSAPAVLVRVVLRQARAAVAAGGLLVALYVLSDFGAVAAMRFEAFTWVIYGAYRSGFNPSRAAVLALVLLLFALVLVVLEAKARGRAAAYRVGAGTPRPAPLWRLGAVRVPALLLVAGTTLVALVVPAVELLRWMSLALSVSVDWAELGGALWSSVSLSVITAVATVLLALPVGVLAARYRTRSARVVEATTYLAHGLPGIVVAISMVAVGVLLLRPWYQQTPLLILAYVVVFLPLAVGSVRSAVEAVPLGGDEVARSLGRSPLAAFLAVTARLAAPGLAAGTAMVLLACMKELPVTLLLHPTGLDTLATLLWTDVSVSNYAAAAPAAAALVLFAAVPTALLGRWSSRAGEIR